MEYPLQGLRVLDFSRVLAGPFAGRMLSDLGADVVKVEPPEGDVTRFWGREIAGLSGYFNQQNAGKRNICIDLRADGAVDLVKQLVASADIVIENFRPDVMGRLGIDYETLSAVNPRLIMLSISGFGHNGPESRRATYAPVVHAEVGLIHRNHRRYGGDYRDLPLSIADTNASLHGLIGILSSVIMRERTGQGQHIDIAMIDATLATDDQIHYDLETSGISAPLNNEIWELPFGPVLISQDFRLLFRLLVQEEYIEDTSTDDMTLEEKIACRRAIVNDFMATMTTRDMFVDMMKRINTAWGEVRNPAQITDQDTVAHRGSITQVDNRDGGTRPVTQSPYRFSNATSGVRGGSSHRGEHNVAVLEDWLGVTGDDADAFRDSGVMLYDPDWHHKTR